MTTNSSLNRRVYSGAAPVAVLVCLMVLCCLSCQSAEPAPGEPGLQGGERSDPSLAKKQPLQEELLQDPIVKSAVAARIREQVASRYKLYFASSSLSLQERIKLVDFLVERRLSVFFPEKPLSTDTLVNGSKAPNSLEGEADGRLEAILGPVRYEAFSYFERTAAARRAVERLERRLELTTEPLSEEQARQMVKSLHDLNKATGKNERILEALGKILSRVQMEEYNKLQNESKQIKDIEGRYGPVMVYFDLK